jgi:membrane-associated protease RseP (regulator of RpoE activity)
VEVGSLAPARAENDGSAQANGSAADLVSVLQSAAQALMEAMDSLSLLSLVAPALLFPLLIFVHELGHALAALALSDGLVQLSVGSRPPWLSGRLGRLAYTLSPVPERRKAVGLTTAHAPLVGGNRVLFVLAGPMANLLLALALIPSLSITRGR